MQNYVLVYPLFGHFPVVIRIKIGRVEAVTLGPEVVKQTESVTLLGEKNCFKVFKASKFNMSKKLTSKL